MTIVITINVDNAAFGETPADTAYEVQRILHELASDIHDDADAAVERRLRDINGNTTGRVRVLEEYQSACYMAARGYLGELTDHATSETWNDDESEVTLTFRESDAWRVQQVCEDDPGAVWSLTSPSTTLGRKFQRFIDSIV